MGWCLSRKISTESRLFQINYVFGFQHVSTNLWQSNIAMEIYDFQIETSIYGACSIAIMLDQQIIGF